jgi:hypothetical protein
MIFEREFQFADSGGVSQGSRKGDTAFGADIAVQSLVLRIFQAVEAGI